MNEQENIELITRVLANEASSEEKNVLNDWIKADKTNEILFNQYQKIWENADVDSDENVDVELAWQKLASKIPSTNNKFYWNNYLRFAAAVLLFAGIGFLLNKFVFSTDIMVQTAINETKIIVLPDGSKVWLNQNSKISYPKNETNERSVILDGEAFFEVVKNPQKPFVITTDFSQTKVLGTSFNLIAYSPLKTVKLTVATGKVSFKSTETNLEQIVLAEETALIDELGKNNKVENFDINETIWKEKKLIFNDNSLADAFKSIEHYFKVEIKTENPNITHCHFTGEFTEPSLKDVMDVVCKTLQLNYKQDNKTIWVKGKGCE